MHKNGGAGLIPSSHPRAESLRTRERLVDGFKRGVTAREGLIAHGRGETFDYLLGEKTTRTARRAIRAAAACLLQADRPVISVNGNVAALCATQLVRLARVAGAAMEVNIFYGGSARKKKIVAELVGAGARRGDILGDRGFNVTLGGLDSARRVVDRDGIMIADAVLVPLEDGDRTEALVAMKKKVISFDLNPLSRTAAKSHITIVDNVTRGMKLLADAVQDMQNDRQKQARALNAFDNSQNLADSISQIYKNLAGRGGGA